MGWATYEVENRAFPLSCIAMAPQNIEPGSANSSCHGSRIPVRLRMPAKRAAEFIIFHHWGPVWQRKVPPNWLNYHAYGSSRTFLGSGTGVWFRGLAVPSETAFGSIGHNFPYENIHLEGIPHGHRHTFYMCAQLVNSWKSSLTRTKQALIKI